MREYFGPKDREKSGETSNGKIFIQAACLMEIFEHFWVQMPYIYRHIRLDTNQPFYIGIGAVSADCYYKRAFNKAQRSQRWKNVANKTAIEVEILLDDLSYEEAKKKEIEFIQLYKRVEDGGSLVNFTSGGDGTVGLFPSEETRKKLSSIRKGRPSPLKGRKLSDEHRKNLSLAGKGRRSHRKGKKIPRDVVEKMIKTNTGKKRKACSDERKRKIGLANSGTIPVIQSLNGIVISEYENVNDVLNKNSHLQLNRIAINRCLNNHQKSYKGYYWTYKK